MANIKISDLTSLPSPEPDDELVVVDVSADVTKKSTAGGVVGVISGDVSVSNLGVATISELPVSKLQDGAARQLLQTDAAGTGVEWTSNVDIPGTLDVTSAATFDAAVTTTGLLSANGKISVPLASGAGPSIYFGTDTDTGIYSPGANQLALSTNGTGRLFVDASGNVGVGGTPTSKFTVIGSAGSVQFASDGATLNFTRNAANYIQAPGAGATLSYRSPVHIFTGASLSNEYLRITSAGLVGIGTGSVDSLLHLATSDANGGYLTFERTSSVIPRGGISFKSSNAGTDYWGGKIVCGDNGSQGTLDFYSAYRDSSEPSTPLMTLLSNGRLGVGTTSPGQPLEIQIDSSSSWTSGQLLNGTDNNNINGLRIFNATSATNAEASILLQSGSSAGAQYSITCQRTGTNAGDLVFRRRSGSAGSAESARIDSSGRLLVGTSSADSTYYISTVAYTPGIQFKGSGYSPSLALNRTDGGAFIFAANSENVTTTGRAFGGISFNGNDGAKLLAGARIVAEADGTTGTDDMPGRLVFSVTKAGAPYPTERMRITSSGRIQLTSTSYIGTLNGDIQNYNGAPGFSASRITSPAASNPYGLFLDFLNASPANTTNWFLRCDDSTEPKLYIYSNGNVVNRLNSYGAISDLKLKENIVDASSQWDDIKALRPVNYNFKEGQTHTQLGLIAQEVELVSPGLVSESPDRDAEGNDLGTVTKSVNYSVLYMKAVKALQEAMERIEQLEAEMAEVKVQLS